MLASFHKIWCLFFVWLVYAYHPFYYCSFGIKIIFWSKHFLLSPTKFVQFDVKIFWNVRAIARIIQRKNSIYENIHMKSIQETFKKRNYCLFNTTDSTFKKKLAEEVSWK